MNWFKSYFSERKQCVIYSGIKSSMLTTKYGVAQGSVLGPILYLTYVNDMSFNVPMFFNFSMYADDRCAYVADKDIKANIDRVSDDLKSINRY